MSTVESINLKSKPERAMTGGQSPKKHYLPAKWGEWKCWLSFIAWVYKQIQRRFSTHACSFNAMQLTRHLSAENTQAQEHTYFDTQGWFSVLIQHNLHAFGLLEEAGAPRHTHRGTHIEDADSTHRGPQIKLRSFSRRKCCRRKEDCSQSYSQGL